jgi:SAM-dependent methyltransferase
MDDDRAQFAAVRPFSPAREELTRLWHEMSATALTPTRAAVAVALGFAAGAPPFAVLRMGIVFLACIWFQLNALLAAGAWLAAFVALRFLPLSARQIGLSGAAIVVGILALVSILPRPLPRPPYRLPPDAPPWIAAIERVAMRYASPVSPRSRDRMKFHWVRGKLLGDPVAKLVARVASGSLLDMGTGRGQLPVLLLELGRISSARGFDWDDDKISDARAAAQGLNASFVVADARTATLETADTVLLIDLLHYFTIEEQDAILERAAAAVRPGGRILVREADGDAGWRSVVTLLEEQFFTRVGMNRGERVCFRPARDTVARLEAAGLRCEVQRAWGKMPFSNLLLIGKRDISLRSDRAWSPTPSTENAYPVVAAQPTIP